MIESKFATFLNKIKNKRVCVIGIGISNIPLIELLCNNSVKVTAHDKKTASELGPVKDKLLALGVTLALGENYLKNLDEFDIIFKTPGLRYDCPELASAREKGICVTSEMEVFFDVCPSKIIAVTGSDGKTTTTSLIYEMLKKEGYNCHVGGNIGAPLLCRTAEISKEDFVVLELSSFQLHTMKKCPNIAVITNISPNHLDFHTDYIEYKEAKYNIFKYQTENDLLVLNAENPETLSLVGKQNGKVLTFSKKTDSDFYIEAGFICFNKEKILNTCDIKIPGNHNIENFLAAIAAVYPFVKKETICHVAKTFGGVPHRIELVRVLDGVRYYNSSIDSSPNRTINTLRVFKDTPVTLIAGGKDKGILYDEIGPAILKYVKTLILIGKTKDKIKEAVEKAALKEKMDTILPIYFEDTYENAVLRAKSVSVSGDVVLLSNASTSFDMFKNFEERGNCFKELVLKL